MASYHLWDPVYVTAEPPTLECFVTLGDSFLLSRGTDVVVRAALDTLSISVEPVSWAFEAMRTHYFSSYRDTSTDWRDRWALAWRLRAAFDRDTRPPVPASPGWGYFDLETVDVTWRPADDPGEWDGWPCLILANVVDRGPLETFRQDVHSVFPDAVCVVAEAAGRIPQLRCDLGFQPRSVYAQGAEPFEALLTRLVAAGAAIRFDDARRHGANQLEQ